MNEQKIKDAVDILTAALNDSIADEPLIAVNLLLTQQDVAILRQICRTNVSIPEAVVKCYPRHATMHSVERVLGKILHEIGR